MSEGRIVKKNQNSEWKKKAKIIERGAQVKKKKDN